MARRLLGLGRWGTCILVLGVSACAPSTGEGKGTGSGLSGGGAANGGSGNDTPQGTGGDPNLGGGLIPIEASGGKTGLGSPDASCGATTLKGETVTTEVQVEVPYEVTEQVPKALYVMLDRSGSMKSDNVLSSIPIIGGFFPPGTNKWKVAVDGLTAFVNDPASAGLKAALHYFPNGGQCDGSGYDTPTVSMGSLVSNAVNIVTSLTGTTPNGNTPTAGALRGVIKYCEAYQAANPSEQCVGVLVTDGDPTDCDPTDAVGLGQLAAGAAAQGIQIFAAGMQGATFSTLDEIGKQGGGDCTPNDPATWACNMTSSQSAFLEALQRIRSQTSTRTRTETRTETRSSTLECEWKIPTSTDSNGFDKTLVNVDFASDGIPKSSLGAVPSEAECANYQGGWYYDDPNAPVNIKVCPTTCDQIKGATNAQVDILLGCKTKPAKLN